ncbi:MAG: DNA-directed RNA polymerase subunit omega [Bacteroidota bacterium]
MRDNDFLPIDTRKFAEYSGNLYRSLMLVTKRANQLTLEVKDELTQKLAEFAPAYDNLEEVMENKEQIEISRFYERKPKSTQIALEEFMEEKVYWKDPNTGETFEGSSEE